MPMAITQETFDEVVKENMEDFGMDREAATGEAVEQFKKQGADMSLVDTTCADKSEKPRDARAAIVAHLDALAELQEQINGQLDGEAASACLSLLSKVGELCRQDGAAGDKYKTALGQAGGVGVLSSLIGRGVEEGSESEGLPATLTCACLSTLKDACRNHEANRDAFLPMNMAKVTGFMLRSLDVDGGDGTRRMVQEGLSLVRILATKTESQKASFMRHQGAEVLERVLRRYGPEGGQDAGVITEACRTLRSVTLSDDRRKDFSSTYENLKTLVSRGVVPLLVEAARAFKADAATLPWIFLALKQLGANNETVNMMTDNGALGLVLEAVQHFPSEVSVCRASLSLLRNMCANDVMKAKLMDQGGLGMILACMQQHQQDPALQEHGCATMGAMALRSPDNGARIVDEGGIAIIVQAMRRYPAARPLQRHACLCVRNIAARGPSLRQSMLDDGCEAALRDAGKLAGCVDEAYMALRDLRCEVGLVTMGEDGAVQVGVAAFGQNRPNFNPTQDETCNLAKRVEASAAAPKDAGFLL